VQKLLIVESYGQIPHALRLLSENSDTGRLILVFLGFTDLFRLFQLLNERLFQNRLRLMYLEAHTPRWATAKGPGRLLWVLPDIIRERRSVKATFETFLTHVENSEVYFFSRGFNGAKLYLLDKLRRKNRLVYVTPKGPPHMVRHRPRTAAELGKLIIWKLTYGRDAVLGRLPIVKGFFYIRERFIEKKVSQVLDEAAADRILEGFDLDQFRVFDARNYRVIFFHEDLVGVGYVLSEDLWRQELGTVFAIVKKHFSPKDIAVKFFPGYLGDTQVVDGCIDTIPSFLPAELLYRNGSQLSVAVFSRSIANLRSGLAVSIADLITFKNEHIRNELKENLRVASRSEILFPQSPAELDRILVDFKAKT